MTSQGVNEAHNSILQRHSSKDSLSVRNSKVDPIKRGSKTSRDGGVASVRSSIKDYSVHDNTKSQSNNNNNITNEIKDLLDKLVSYQGKEEVSKKGSVSSKSQNSSSNQHNSSIGA
jgi:hypothetical protein